MSEKTLTTQEAIELLKEHLRNHIAWSTDRKYAYVWGVDGGTWFDPKTGETKDGIQLSKELGKEVYGIHGKISVKQLHSLLAIGEIAETRRWNFPGDRDDVQFESVVHPRRADAHITSWENWSGRFNR